MAIPKKSSRKIIIENEPYRWLIRKKATNLEKDYGNGYINLAVEHEEAHGSVLVIFTSKPHPKDWATKEVEAITPEEIKKWINMAIENGWLPKASGNQFQLHV